MKLNSHFAKRLMLVSVIAVTSLWSLNASAQSDVVNMIKGGATDASKLVKAYISPTMKGFGAGLNNGWYNTARPHKLGRFDITFALNAAFVPTEDQTYSVASLGLQTLRLKAGSGTTGQTVSGESDPVNPPVFEVMVPNPTNPGTDTAISEFTAPPGAGLAYSGAPTVQFAIGLVKGTEVMIRYMPTIALGDAGDVGLVGFGVKHDIKQWIPGIKDMPFDLSGYFGYTKFDLELKFKLDAENGVPQRDNAPAPSYDDQNMTMSTSATTFGAIISKKLAIFTVYGSVGYNLSKTTLKMNGMYPVTNIEDRVGNPNFGNRVVDNIKDPVNFDVTNNGLKAQAGFRMKLLILTIHADYTVAKYPIASAGIGINIGG